MGTIKKSALLKTSSALDAKLSGGVIYITGLMPFKQSDLLGIKELKYKAETVQVITVGANSYTPVASTAAQPVTYSVKLVSPAFSASGNKIMNEKTYSYTMPITLTDAGANAAAQRETIHAAIVAKMNADGYNFVTAATLGTGTGFTITDDAGYYPARVNGSNNGRQGATGVYFNKSDNNSGWVQSDVVTVTTPAVYSFGVGSTMDDETPIFANAIGQNLISGELDAPVAADGTYAVAGQKYSGFIVETLVKHDVPTIGGGIFGSKVAQCLVVVDNGAGSDTANATGYQTFVRKMRKLQYAAYAKDINSAIEFFDEHFIAQTALGAVPATTGAYKFVTPYGALTVNQIGTQTIITPVLSDTGLLLDQDLTATEGAEFTTGLTTLCDKKFVARKEAMSVTGRVAMANWTDACVVLGLRKKAAYAADFNDYTDLAAIGTGAAAGDTITTQGILNNAVTVTAAPDLVSLVDGTAVTFRICVDKDGYVTAYANGIAYPIYSTGTTQLRLDDGDEMVPFFRVVNIGGGDPDAVISMFAAVADDSVEL